MNIRLEVLRCTTDKKDRYDITDIVEKIDWSGDYKQSARKLEFSIGTGVVDANFPKIDIPCGSMVFFYVDNKELFRGFVVNRSKDSSSNTLDFTCYDNGFRLLKVKSAYNFKNITAESIVSKICTDYGLTKGDIATTNVKISKVFLGVNLYEIIMTAYTEASKKNGKKYMCLVDKDKICVREKGITKLKIGFEEGYNLKNTTFSESIENMVNKVIVVDENGNKKATYQKDNLIKIYGLFQEVVQQSGDKQVTKEEAESNYNDIEQTCNLKGIGDITCTTGHTVQIKDSHTGLIGVFHIDSDKHSWTKGEYEIELGLNFKNIMNEVTAGQEEKEKSTSTLTSSNGDTSINSSGGSEKARKALEYAYSKKGCKYVWGATGPRTFDCSGLTQWCYKQVGIRIPRVSREQSRHGQSVSKNNLQPGDLVFFGNPVHHVGMYCGGGKYIHAPQTGDVVKVSNLGSRRDFHNARRVV